MTSFLTDAPESWEGGYDLFVSRISARELIRELHKAGYVKTKSLK